MSPLSKHELLTGLRCRKALWWMTHEPFAPELKPSETLKELFDQGRQVGELARTYVPGGELVGKQFISLEDRVVRTKVALDGSGSVLYEAAFATDGAYVQVDILERLPVGWRIVEVKSSTAVAPKHITDVAVQCYVAKQAGLDVREVQVMHLNKTCFHPRLETLFVRSDVTADVTALLRLLPGPIQKAIEGVSGELPNVPIGDHCWKPQECPFTPRCHPAVAPDDVDFLYRLSPKKRAALAEQAIKRIADIPNDFVLSSVQERQRKSITSNELIVDQDLPNALSQFRGPLAFLDFETITRAIPVWDKCAPWQQVPAQFSCHVQTADGSVGHYEWLADGPGDPRRPLAEALIRACEGSKAVLAYYMQFEKSRIEELGQLFPDLKESLFGISDKLADLLPIVRENVYHPSFAGGFGLKAVAPALIGLNYEELEINSGGKATIELGRLLLTTDVLTTEQRKEIRSNLLTYCKQDTWCLVKLLARLQELAPGT